MGKKSIANDTDYIEWLQTWYEDQCVEWTPNMDPNDLWQESKGITIESLDNPGWSIGIHITGTEIDDVILPVLKRKHADNDWITVETGVDESVSGNRIYQSFCDPNKLKLSIHIFKLLTERNIEEIFRIMNAKSPTEN